MHATKEVVERRINKYNSGKPFAMIGISVKPPEIRQIVIFKSLYEIRNYILPNGKRTSDEDNHLYIANSFSRGRVNGVVGCTSEFDISAPQEAEEAIETPITPVGRGKRVFIVHGRNQEQALRLQKYLTRKLKADAEMFEDFKEESGSNTIIEQLEYIKDNVGYAFVIVTPDDYGCLREDIDKCRSSMIEGKRSIPVKSVDAILKNLHTRPRQNVVFEHGLFIGALGRDNVCCLLQKDTEERPSDTDGILYVGLEKSVRENFADITEKLRKANLIKG